MIESIAMILTVLFLLGMVSGYTFGNWIMVLPLIAGGMFLYRLFSENRPVGGGW